MSDPKAPAKPAAPPASGASRVGNFLGWAFVISLVLHAITLPFFGLKAQSHEKQEVEKVSVTKKIKVQVPTPPPPTPTPPPPTPPPKSTPPPVKQTAPPPTVKLKLNVVKTEHKAGPTSEKAYVAPPVGNENGNPNGTVASAAPAAVTSTAIPATPAPTPVPPTATPKPSCANPNEDASIRGTAVEPDFPEVAKQQGATGSTQVKVTLDAAGNPVDVSVYKSSGFATLDQSALKAAKATQYNAELINCVKSAGSYLFTADFSGQ